MRMWAITKVGKRASRDIQVPDSIDKQVLNFMHEFRTATTDDVANGNGISTSRASTVLGKLSSRGLVVEMTKEDRNVDI